jgi:hypothetical protein
MSRGKRKRRRKRERVRQSALLRREVNVGADTNGATTKQDGITGLLPNQPVQGSEGNTPMPRKTGIAEWMRNNANSVIAIFTVVIAIATILQIFIYTSQLDEMRIDQRAWLAIKFEPAQPTLNSPFTWPLIINNTG